jgi:hypothetical protein
VSAETVPASAEVLAEARKSYLAWVVETTNRIPVRGLREASGAFGVPLEDMYVALRIDSSSPSEREAATGNLRREWERAFQEHENSPEDEQEQLRWFLQADMPVADYFGTSDWLERYHIERAQVLNMADLYNRGTSAVILGDPGSGKSTVARWLALIHARAQENGNSEVRIPRKRIDPAAAQRAGDGEPAEEEEVSLGQSRLPVLLRIGEYMADRQKRIDLGHDPLVLFEYLGFHALELEGPKWQRGVEEYMVGDRVPPAVLRQVLQAAVRDGNALVVLDGLDEVAQESRNVTVEAVDSFIHQWERPADASGPNKILVTSRIAGYQLAPLAADITQVTIERMGNDALKVFIANWFREVIGELDQIAERRHEDHPQRSPDGLADEFWVLLRQPANRYVRDICANPLLASIVLSVFVNTGGSLPAQRVEVYEEAIQALVRVWSDRLSKSYDEVEREFLFDALPAVAAHIHRNNPSGVIHKEEFRRRMLAEVARLRNTDPRHPSPALRAEVTSLVNTMRSELGLLVECGPDVFRFSHRTFQEFLAARDLISDPDESAARILPLLGDPGWREPVLMAFELVNWEQPENITALADSLLNADNPLTGLFPETALLLTEAVPQMTNAPSDVVQKICAALLDAYARLYRERRLPVARELIERAVATLRAGEHRVVIDSALAASLTQPRDGDTGYACAVARLIQQLPEPSARLADALLAAERSDRPDIGSPIAEALTVLVSPAIGHAETELQPRLAAEWGTGRLRMRAILSRDQDLVDYIRQDPAWLCLMLALYGGMWNMRAGEALDDYHRLIGYLQLPDEAQRACAAFFGHRWNPDNPVLGMQLRLEVSALSSARRRQQRPEFTPAAITRYSMIDRWVIDAFRDKRLDRLADRLRGQTRAASDEMRAEALLALWATGSGDDAALGDGSEAARLARKRISALRVVLRDTVVRAAPHAAAALLNAAGTLPVQDWSDLYTALTAVLIDAGADPISFLDSMAQLPMEYREIILREEITHRLSGWGEAHLANAFKLADSVTTDQYPGASLGAALNTRGSAAHSGYRRYAHWWPADPLDFQHDPRADIPISVFDQLLRLPHEMSFGLVWALRDVLKPILDRNPRLCPEAAAVAWTQLGHGDIDIRGLIEMLDSGLLTSADPAEHLIGQAERLQDPWHRARTLLRVAGLFPASRSRVLPLAVRACAEVSDPARAFELQERLFQLVPEPEKGRCYAAGRRLAGAIPDPGTAVLAFLRLTRVAPAADVVPLAESALQIAGTRKAGPNQARLLRLIASTLPEQGAVQDAVARLLQATGENAGIQPDRAHVISRFIRALTSDDDASIQMWTPVVLYARAVAVESVQRGNEEIRRWARLAAEPSAEGVAALLTSQGGALIQCTGTVARCLSQALASGGPDVLRPLLGRLVHLDCAAQPVVRSWLGHDDPDVRSAAALLLTEYQGLSAELVRPVTDCLINGDDLVRARARQALATHWGSAQCSVTGLGPAAINQLAEFALGNAWEHPGAETLVRWRLPVLLHDDPQALSGWCDEIEHEQGERQATARKILSNIGWITDLSWSVMLARLRDGSPVLQRALLASVALMVEGSQPSGEELAGLRVDGRRWEQLWEVLRRIDPVPLREPCLLASSWEIVMAAEAALKASTGVVSDETFTQASLELRKQFATTYGDVLALGDSGAARDRLVEIGGFQRVKPDAIQQAAEALRVQSAGSPSGEWPWVELMTAWTQDLLMRFPYQEMDYHYWEVTHVMEVTAAAAELSPDRFRASADAETLSQLLAEAVLHLNGWVGRAVAARLLGALRHESEDVLDALQRSLQDISNVWQEALDAVPKLIAVDYRLVTNLLKELRHSDGRVAWTASRLLTTIGRSAATPSAVRSEIITALARAARDPGARRTVHLTFSNGMLPQMPELDDVFADALRSIYQFSANETDIEEISRDGSLASLAQAQENDRIAAESGFWADKLLKSKNGDLVWLVRGKDGGKAAWHYVLLSRSKIALFRRAVQTRSLDVSHYGTILYSGWGEDPPDSMVETIQKEYG